MITLPTNVQAVIDDLHAADVTCVLVGGVVRDLVLSQLRDDHVSKSPDWDFELFTTHSAEFIESILRRHGSFRVDNVNGDFQVMALTLPDGTPLDFSFPREDIPTGEGGHTDFIINRLNQSFSTEFFKKAASRRDFTMGAMGIRMSDGMLLDPFGAQEHLRQGLIVCVDEQAFVKDPLRMLRGIRFACQLGLELDTTTAELMTKHADKVAEKISHQRITMELTKMLESRFPRKGFRQAIGIFGDSLIKHGLTRMAFFALSRIAMQGEFLWNLFILHRFSTERLWTLTWPKGMNKRMKFADEVISLLERSTSQITSRRIALMIGLSSNKLDRKPEEIMTFISDIVRGDAHLRRSFNRSFNEIRHFLAGGLGKPLVNGSEIKSLGVAGPQIRGLMELANELQIQGLTKEEILNQLRNGTHPNE